ncbi:MAG: hypothetical protein M3Y45_02985 [Actinomycetota bacterium]|nr:hypothetical protein [Actinomycetota bacterium]
MDQTQTPPADLKTFSVEVLDPESGLFVSLTAGGNGAIMLGDDVIGAAPIPAGGLDPLSAGAPLSLETEHGELEVEIGPAGDPILFEGGLTGRREARLIEVSGRLVEGDRTIELECAGVLHAREDEPPAGSTRRDLTVILADGGLLCVAAAGPVGSERHSEEESVAAISHPGGYLEFEEALISTEYDGAGRQYRASLELWPASGDVAVLHGAGTVISGCTARLPSGVVNTALFRWSLDGHLGMGRYEITRPVKDAA